MVRHYFCGLLNATRSHCATVLTIYSATGNISNLVAKGGTMTLTDKCKLRITLSLLVSHVLRIDGTAKVVYMNTKDGIVSTTEGFSHGLNSHTAWWEDVQHDTDQ